MGKHTRCLTAPAIRSEATTTTQDWHYRGGFEGRRYTSQQEQHTDGNASSGMCKAGFAGDDAPRAVFRKLSLQMHTCRLQLTPAQLPLSADRATMGMHTYS